MTVTAELRELDARIHREVMARGAYSTTNVMDPPPRYSADIAAAWLVVEKMKQLGHPIDLMDGDDGWSCYFFFTPAGKSENQPTAPLAICLAALESVGARAHTRNPKPVRRG